VVKPNFQQIIKKFDVKIGQRGGKAHLIITKSILVNAKESMSFLGHQISQATANPVIWV